MIGPNGGATTKWGSGDYGFDGAGNITAIGAKSYTYDRVSRLATAPPTTPSAGR